MKARIEAAFGNAKQVVAWLQNRPEVEKVLWPVLESHPDHAIFKRDFTGGTTLFPWSLSRNSTANWLR